MTLAGKEFKNIYDSGAKMLTDIELESIAKIKQDKEEHSLNHRKSADQSLQHLEDKSSLLQGELKQSIDASLNKLESTLALENTQTEVFVSSLLSELNILTEQMKMKLKALKQSHQENVDFAGTVATENYLTDTEEVSFELEQTLSRSLDNLSAQGKVTLANLNENLADKLSQGDLSMDEIIKSTLLSAEEQTQTINSHTASLLQTSSTNSQTKFKVLEQAARDANQEVEAVGRSLLGVIANHAANIEKDVNLDYDQITSAHFQSADNRLGNCADELSELHDTTTEQLVNYTEEYSTDLSAKSNQVQEGLRRRCAEVVKRVEDSYNEFKTHLDTRLQFSRGQKQALESDKNKLLVAVQNEMLSIQKSFAIKLATVLEQSKSELTDMTNGVEEQIGKAVKSFGDQMNTSAQSIQKQIEDEVAKLLQELSTSRSGAMSEILNAAKGDSQFSPKQRNFNDVVSKPDEELLPSEPVLQQDVENSEDTEMLMDAINESSNAIETRSRRNRRRKDTKE